MGLGNFDIVRSEMSKPGIREETEPTLPSAGIVVSCTNLGCVGAQ